MSNPPPGEGEMAVETTPDATTPTETPAPAPETPAPETENPDPTPDAADVPGEEASPDTAEADLAADWAVLDKLDDLDPEEITSLKKHVQENNLTPEETKIKILELGINLPQIKEILEAHPEPSDDPEENKAVLEEIGAAMSERLGPETLELMAQMALGAAREAGLSFAKWAETSIQDSDLTRLLDAIILGADYNSINALHNLETNADKDAVSSNEFFKFFHNPNDAAEKLSQIGPELETAANWGGAREGIKQALEAKDQNETQEKLQAFLIELYEIIEHGHAPHLAKKCTSQLLAKKLFAKDILNPEVWGKLEDLKDHKVTLAQLSS